LWLTSQLPCSFLSKTQQEEGKGRTLYEMFVEIGAANEEIGMENKQIRFMLYKTATRFIFDPCERAIVVLWQDVSMARP
jgi:hypothetical protein